MLSALLLSSVAGGPEEVIAGFHGTVKTFTFDHYPDFSSPDIAWNSRNELSRRPGSPFLAKGRPVILEGIVRDVAGIPVDSAQIRIVQTNTYGVYNYEVEPGSPFYDENFLSTGSALTDNTGYYSFRTIFPGYYEDRAPHIDFEVRVNDRVYYFEMFFPDHPRNSTDPIYSQFGSLEQRNFTAEAYWSEPGNSSKGMRIVFNISVNSVQPFKKL